MVKFLKNRREVFVSFLLTFFIYSCASNGNYPSKNEIRDAYSFLNDSVVKMNLEFYDICNAVNYELNDSNVVKSLKMIDSLITQSDIDFMLSQYKESRYKHTSEFLDLSNYIYKKGHDYYPEDSIRVHLSYSIPLFSRNHQFVVIYNIARTISNVTGIDGYFFLLKKNDNTWTFIDVYKNEYCTPDSNKVHSHTGSYIPKRK